MVEPVRRNWAKCSALYSKHASVKVLCAAVDDQAGERVIYTVDDPAGELPEFTAALASFSRDHVMSFESLVPGLAKYIREERVECWTLAEVLQRGGLERFDVLQIDTEGHDKVVLDQLDLERIHPALIQLEHAHLPENDVGQVILRLRRHGYGIVMEGRDLCAFLPQEHRDGRKG